MGLFEAIERAWFTVDNKLYLWDYNSNSAWVILGTWMDHFEADDQRRLSEVRSAEEHDRLCGLGAGQKRCVVLYLSYPASPR